MPGPPLRPPAYTRGILAAILSGVQPGRILQQRLKAGDEQAANPGLRRGAWKECTVSTEKNPVETLQGQKLFRIKVHEIRGLLVRCLFGGKIVYSQREDERKSYGKQAVDEPVTADESRSFRCGKSEIQSI